MRISTMTRPHLLTRRLVLPLVAALLLAVPARAQDHGHDHGHDHGGGAETALPTNPRGVTETPVFQMAAVVARNALVVYLDHTDSNAPVSGAKIEVTEDADSYTLVERGDGTYVAENWKSRPGRHNLMMYVEAGDTTDLLSVTLEIPAAAVPAAPGAHEAIFASSMPLLIGVPLAVLLGLAANLLVDRTQRRAVRAVQTVRS
jgi:hypothetical protein